MMPTVPFAPLLVVLLLTRCPSCANRLSLQVDELQTARLMSRIEESFRFLGKVDDFNKLVGKGGIVLE